MDYQQIAVEHADGRCRITLDRPSRRNALSDLLLEELDHALWDADDRRDVHCVILRGAGVDFCAGYDLTGSGRDPQPGRRDGRTIDDDIWLLERNNRRIRTIFEMHKPTIAQVQGHCLAGGTDLALACVSRRRTTPGAIARPGRRPTSRPCARRVSSRRFGSGTASSGTRWRRHDAPK